MRSVTFLLLSACALYSQTFNVLYSSVGWSPGSQGEGHFIVNTSTGAVTKVSSWSCDAALSPDGRKIAFLHGGGALQRLYICDNTGYAGEQSVIDLGREDANIGSMSYTTRGVFWLRKLAGDTNSLVYRYDVDNGVLDTVLYIPIWPGQDNLGYYTSRDGTRQFAWMSAGEDWGAPDDHYCPYITLNSDLTSYQYQVHHQWGHGNVMLSDGLRILQVTWLRYPHEGYYHQNVYVVTHPDGVITDTLYNQLPTGATQEEGNPIRNICGVVNSDDYVIINCGLGNDKGDWTSHYWHWEDESMPVVVPGADVGALQGAWMGDLPDPESSVSLSPSLVSLTSEDSTTEVVVSVGGGAGTPTVSVPDDGAWLSATLSGSGPSYTLAVTAQPSDAAESDTGLVTVSAPGVSEPETLTVFYSAAGFSLQPPVSLAFTPAGDSGLDVSLTWTNVAVGADGTIIERRTDEGAYEVIDTVGPVETAYLDEYRAMGAYFYRLKTYRGSEVSADSDELAVEVSGIPWIRMQVTPATAAAGQDVTVNWEANRVTSVQMEASIDEGETWEKITAGESIGVGGEDWGAFTWTVPDTFTTASVLIRIHPYQELSPLVQTVLLLSGAAVHARATPEHAASPSRVAYDLQGNVLTVSSSHFGTLRLYAVNGRLVREVVFGTDGGAVEMRRIAAGMVVGRRVDE